MKRWLAIGLAIGLVVLSAGALLTAAAQNKAEEPAEDVDFWTSFKSLFLTEEPEYEDRGPKRTEVTGVRGLDQEGKMGESYDWQAVREMEDFMVTEKDMFQFLKDGAVGPFAASNQKRGGK